MLNNPHMHTINTIDDMRMGIVIAFSESQIGFGFLCIIV